MHRVWLITLFLLLVLSACGRATPSATATARPSSTATHTPSPTASPTLTATPLPSLTPSETATPERPTFEVRTHPDPALYVGDQVSFEIIPVDAINLDENILRIYAPNGAGEPLAEGRFGSFGIAGR